MCPSDPDPLFAEKPPPPQEEEARPSSSSSSSSIDSRWNDAVIRKISCDTSSSISSSITVQIARLDPGRGKEGHTCFARLRMQSSVNGEILDSVTLQYVVYEVLCCIANDENTSQIGDGANELIKIGAVWMIPATTAISGNERTNKNKQKTRPRRATSADASMPLENWKDVIIRIHHGAIRYTNVYQYDWGKP